MKEFSKILPNRWIGKKAALFKSLNLQARYLHFYLETCRDSNMLGIFYISIPQASHETGFTFEETEKALAELINASLCCYDFEEEYIWVKEISFSQMGQLSPNDNNAKSLNNEYLSLPSLRFLEEFYEECKNLFHLTEKRENKVTPSGTLPPPLVPPSTPLGTPLAPPSTYLDLDQDLDLNQEKKEKLEQKEKKSFLKNRKAEVREIFEHWQRVMRKPKAMLDQKRRRKIEIALENYPKQRLLNAVLGCSLSDFHMGRDGKNVALYNDLELILRDSEHIEKFEAIYEKNKPKPSAEALKHDIEEQEEREKLERKKAMEKYFALESDVQKSIVEEFQKSIKANGIVDIFLERDGVEKCFKNSIFLDEFSDFMRKKKIAEEY